MTSPPPLFDPTWRPAAAREHAPACPGRPQAAGLVSSKTSGTPPIEISFDVGEVQRRRLGRLKRTVWACAHWHVLTVPRGHRERVWFVTLTYRGVADWLPRHVSDSLTAVRKWCQRQAVIFKYVWVAELQKRGAIHYHLAIWLPVRLQLPKFDKRGWWPHGMTQTVIGRAPVGYLMKYLSKTGPLQAFPKGARIHGYGGLSTQARSVCTWLNWPQWCKQRFGVGQLCTIAGRRVVRETGEVLEPMYTRVVIPAGMRLYPNGPLPDRWADGPYSLLEVGAGAQ
jgi:hypothetical protein